MLLKTLKITPWLLALSCLISGWWYGIGFRASVAIGLKKGIVTDLYPFWNGCHAVLSGIDPYGPEITTQNEISAFGTEAKNVKGEMKERQFAYPAYAAFATFPLGLVPFPIANRIAFWVFAGLLIFSLAWTRGIWDHKTVLWTILALGTYPIIFSIQSRQPTILFLALAIATYALFSSNHLCSAGVIAALSCGKPHVAMAILLPILVRSISEWRKYKSFVFSFATTLLALFIITNAVMSGWFPEWIGALYHYSHQAAGPSVVAVISGRAYYAVSALLLCSLLTSLWVKRGANLLSQVALSVMVFQLILPWEFYNSIALLIPIIWAFDNTDCVNQFALALLRVSLIEYWVATAIGAFLLQWNLATSLAWRLPALMLTPVLATTLIVVLSARNSLFVYHTTSERL
jgi:hypothetical protein